MKNFETNGFKELTCEELKEIQGGMTFWQALLGFGISLGIGLLLFL
jgi:bacteriocin-like protein